MGKRPKAPTEFVWQMVLVDRELLERARKATRAAGASEAIDRALSLATRRTERRARRSGAAGRSATEDAVATFPIH